MRITKAILPVAGLGTRFMPWTKAVPKELLPIGNRPIIAHLVDECLDAGITDICFVISEGKEAIPRYFEHDQVIYDRLAKKDKLHHLDELQKYNNAQFNTVYQSEQLGDGHAILQATDWIDEEPVAVLFGDDLFLGDESGLTQLIKAYEHADNDSAMVALESIPKDQTHRYGIVEVEHEHEQNPRLKKLKGMVEKPHPDKAPSLLGIVGRYLLPKGIFEALPKVGASHGGEIRIIDALIEKLDETPIYGYECTGKRLDTGTPEGYAKAVQAWFE